MRAPPFAPALYPAISQARARSAPVNADWLAGPFATVAARFAGIETAEDVEANAGAYLAESHQLETLVSPLIGALADDPWFEPAFKVSRDRLRMGIVLLDCPAITLSVPITGAGEPNQLPPPATVVLPGQVTLTQ